MLLMVYTGQVNIIIFIYGQTCLNIGVGNGGGGAQGTGAPPKIAAPYIFKVASVIHVHPEWPPNQIMFPHQCCGHLSGNQ